MRKVLFSVLISAVSGSKYFRESRSGPIVLQSKDGKLRIYELETKKGVGMDDLSIPSRHGITYGALRQLGINLAQLKKYFHRLIDLQPPVLRIIRIENGSIRYGFIDHLLSNFVQECELILSNALTRMES